MAESWELEFLLTRFSEGCFTARDENGKTLGFVTSLRHERSGWIGNLIVAPLYRGQGIGAALFTKALEALREGGAETQWLTASPSGMPLYQKYGFRRIDTIHRWSGSGRGRDDGYEAAATVTSELSLLQEMDSLGWGERRTSLMEVTTGRGRLLRQDFGLMVVQPCRDGGQLGPFSAHGYGTAEALLKSALRMMPCGTKICLDAPASNRSAMQLYSRNKMSIGGSSELMYAGVRPAYQPEYIYALATMGSCG